MSEEPPFSSQEQVLYDWWIEHFRCDFLIAKLNGEGWAQGEWEEHVGHRSQARAYVKSQMAALAEAERVEP